MQVLETKSEPFGPYEAPVLMDIASWGFKDWIEEISDGRIQIEMLEPESVFPSGEAPTAVGSGAVDAYKGCPMHWAGTMPEMNVVGGMPGTAQSVSEFYVLWYKYGVNERIADLYDEYNVVFLPITGMEYMNLMAPFPLPDPDSTKGYKFRGPGPWADYVKLVGGTPVSLPFSEMYMAIKLGTIDGAFTGIHALETAKLKEVITDFVTNPNPCLDGMRLGTDARKKFGLSSLKRALSAPN